MTTKPMKKELTEFQQLLRELIHYGNPLTEPEMFWQLTACLKSEGMTNAEIDSMMCEFQREKEMGIYLYPPPKITQENMHHHICDPPEEELMLTD